jgi:hypothetical protein
METTWSGIEDVTIQMKMGRRGDQNMCRANEEWWHGTQWRRQPNQALVVRTWRMGKQKEFAVWQATHVPAKWEQVAWKSKNAQAN